MTSLHTTSENRLPFRDKTQLMPKREKGERGREGMKRGEREGEGRRRGERGRKWERGRLAKWLLGIGNRYWFLIKRMKTTSSDCWATNPGPTLQIFTRTKDKRSGLLPIYRNLSDSCTAKLVWNSSFITRPLKSPLLHLTYCTALLVCELNSIWNGLPWTLFEFVNRPRKGQRCILEVSILVRSL